MMGGQGGSSSNLDKLVKAWGYEFDPGKVVLDMKYMAGSGPRAVPTVIQLDGNAMSKDDVTTSHLGTTLLAFAGAFSGKPAEGLKESVLMHTSPIVKLVESANAMARGEEAVRGFQPEARSTRSRSGSPASSRPRSRTAGRRAEGGGRQGGRDAKDKPAPAADLGPALKEAQARRHRRARRRQRHAERRRRRADPRHLRPEGGDPDQRQPRVHPGARRADGGRLGSRSTCAVAPPPRGRSPSSSRWRRRRRRPTSARSSRSRRTCRRRARSSSRCRRPRPRPAAAQSSRRSSRPRSRASASGRPTRAGS